ncbi:Panacea domain-containing protein [Jannaschia pohangensis]|uniref:Uncharacterized phage-associated protein n=1 Tax=Jannaschia pohangensis TaxID=390807 RepID=A0A1I3Q9Z8_9RHOB|nr:Uncharacterized phage-associated protein [Jannaschia pohangensis]
MHDPRSIANFIIDVRRFLNAETTSLELQKLLYFCHASYLKRYGTPLVSGNFEAWDFGPVHPVVYKAFKSFGRSAIISRAKSINAVTGEVRPIPRPDKPVQRHVIQTVTSLFDMTAGQLVDLSHAKNAPWDVVWRHKDSRGTIISDRTIDEHYRFHHLPRIASEKTDASIAFEDVPPYDH